MAQTYFPYQIEQMSEGAIRKAYSELRKVANKRLARLQKAGLGSYGSFRYGKLEQMHPDDVAEELADVSRFLRERRTTVRGAKAFQKNVVSTLQEKGGVFADINQQNFRKWTDFMDNLREKYGNKLFDSGDATDVFSEVERLNLPDSIIENHYKMFVDNIETIRDIGSIENAKNPGKAVRFTDFKNAIAKAKDAVAGKVSDLLGQ